MAIKIFNEVTQQWETCASAQAIETKTIDVGDNFESDNVEGCLRELNENFTEINNSFREHVLNHPGGSGGSGGGGGTVLPTITSTFEGGIVEEGTSVNIDIFFSSPNLGDGIAYILLDGIETSVRTIKQGNNRINIGELPNLKNTVSIYVVDRAGLTSNQLTWVIVSGGISLSIDFDFDADYSISDTIRMPYNITTESNDPIYLKLTIDGDEYTHETTNGYNEYVFTGLGVGVHTVTVCAVTGKYSSKSHNFNIVVVNSNSLYVSSTFKPGRFEYGVPININYRISKLSTETFTVKQILDGEVVKTLELGIGSYYWILSKVEAGNHTLKIEVESPYGEYAELSFDIEVYYGEYTPVQPVKTGLIAWFDASEKTNNDADKDIWNDKSGYNTMARLHGFNYSTNGWVNNSLVCDGNAYVEIDLKPYEDNARLGSTIDILYKPLNIGVETAKILDYVDVDAPYKGVNIDLLEASLASLANKGTVGLDEDEYTRLTFVIDRTNKFGKIYVNAVLCRAFFLSDTGSGVNKVYEDFSHNQKMYLNSEKGIKNFGACEIKNLRVYSRALDHEEVLQNHIADIVDLEEQKEIYKFNYENTSTPVIRMYGDTTNMTGDVAVPMRIKYISPNEELYGQSFDLNYCQVHWQGTSSLQYVLKNYTIYLKDDNMADFYYSPYRNGIKENIFCLKADYMESSHANNVGLAKFINDSVYDSKNPAQLKDDRVRNSINGFPILLYINDELKGCYNFNLDRYSPNSFGYDKSVFPKCLCYEVSANSDTTAGAFHKWTSSTGKTEIDYLASDFEAIFPPDRAAGNDTFDEIKRLVDWVNDADDELFKEQIHEYFNLEYLLRYYLVVMIFGLVDNLGKNMKLTTWDGLVWYPQFYDLDTALGLDNTGFLKFDSDIEVEAGIFNTSGSNLWSKVARVFQAELIQQYALMRQDRFTVENIMKYIYGEQVSQIPQINYNKDMQTKYLNFGSSYLYACHGNRYQHMKRWIRERLVYVDTLMEYYVSTSDFITIRANKQGPVYLDLQTYVPMYLKVKWRDEANNTGVQVQRVGRGEKVRFTYNMPTATDQEVIIYGGQYLKNLGDVSNLQPTTMLIANAKKLTSIECHSPNLINTDLSACTLMQEIDISNCSKLGTGVGAQPTLNLSDSKYLRKIDISGTALTAVYTSQAGGNLEEIYYPSTVQQIQLANQKSLHTIGIPYDEEHDIACKNLNLVSINNCPNVSKMCYPYDETNQFLAFKYVQNLSIINSLQIENMNFDGFHKLKTVTLSSLKTIRSLGFDNMSPKGAESTLRSITIADCPNVTTLTMNCTSDDYTITFAQNAVLDLSGAGSIAKIESNYSIKGLKTIILPLSIKDIEFIPEYGDVTCDIKNLWSSSTAYLHESDGFTGIDLTDIKLRNINLGSLLLINDAINFNIAPTNVNPYLNTNRDNVTYPYFQPEGVIDLTNYTGGFNKFFGGVDLNKLQVICNKPLPQTDFSYCFYNSTFDNTDNFESLLRNIIQLSNGSYMFAGTTITNIDILNRITLSEGAILDYMFAGCLNLVSADGLNISNKVSSAIGMLKDCTNITTATNMRIRARGPVKQFMQGCRKLTTIAGGILENVTDCSFMFEGDSNLTNVLDKLPSTVNGKAVLMYGDCGIEILSNTRFEKGSYTQGYNDNGIFKGCPIKRVENVYFDVDLGTAGRNWTWNGLDQQKFFKGVSTIEYVDIEVGPNCRKLELAFLGNKVSYCKIVGNSFTSIKGMFHSNSSPTLTLDIDTSNVIDMSYAFASLSCNSLNLGNKWNTSNTENMSSMFDSSSLPSLDLSDWNFSSLQSLSQAFRQMTKITYIKLAGNFKNLTTISYAFYQCSSATEIDLSGMIISSKFVDMNTTFAAMSKLVRVSFPSNLEESGLTNFSHFTDCTISNLDVYNYRIPPSATKVGAWNFGGVGGIRTYVNLHNVYIGNNEIISDGLFRTTAIKSIDDNIEFNPNVSKWNFDNAFKGATNLTNDFIFPESTVSAINCFKDCTKMKAIHSNWKISYIRDIDATDCYAGCTGIITLDGEVVVNEYSTGLDEVPVEWGGYGLTKAVTGIYEMQIPTDDYTFEFGSYGTGPLYNWNDTYAINWGDGTSTIGERTHTYAKAGTYIIKGKVCCGGNGYGPSASVQQCLTRVLQIPTNKSSMQNGNGLSYMFNGCKDLTYVNMTNHPNIKSLSSFVPNCSSLTTVDFTGSNFDECGGYNSTFSGCKSLTSIPGFKVISTSVEACVINNIMTGCSSLEILDTTEWSMTNVSMANYAWNNCSNLIAIEGIENWDLKNLTSFYCGFGGCTNLKRLDGLVITSKTTTIAYLLSNCKKIEDFSFINEWDTSKVTDYNRAFENCQIPPEILKDLDVSSATNLTGLLTGNLTITNLDFLSNWNTSKVTTIESFCLKCTELIDMTGILNWTNFNPIYISALFQGCTSLTKIDLRGLNFSRLSKVNSLAYDCHKLEELYIDMPNTVTVWERLVQNCNKIKKIHCVNLDSLRNITGWRFFAPYNNHKDFMYYITVSWAGKLMEETSSFLLDALTYVNSTTYGIFKRITVESFEDLLNNHLHDYSNSDESPNVYVTIEYKDIISEEAVANAVSKGWTVVFK